MKVAKLKRAFGNKHIMRDMVTGFFVKLFRALFILGLCYLFLFPVYYFIVTAIQDPLTAKSSLVVWIPSKFTLENFIRAMDLMRYRETIMLSISITLISTAAMMISCSLAGYGFARFEFFEKKLAFALVVLIIIVPPQTIMIPSFVNFRYFDVLGIINATSRFTGVDHINFLNTVWPFTLPSLFASGLRAGLFIFIFRQFFTNLPKELEEAARIDGCGAFKTFGRIIVPLTGPAFLTVMLFSLVWHWNETYLTGLYFTELRPVSSQLSLLLRLFTADFVHQRWTITQMRGGLAAGSLLMIAPPLMLYAFTQRYFTESIERAGIVG